MWAANDLGNESQCGGSYSSSLSWFRVYMHCTMHSAKCLSLFASPEASGGHIKRHADARVGTEISELIQCSRVNWTYFSTVPIPPTAIPTNHQEHLHRDTFATEAAAMANLNLDASSCLGSTSQSIRLYPWVTSAATSEEPTIPHHTPRSDPAYLPRCPLRSLAASTVATSRPGPSIPA